MFSFFYLQIFKLESFMSESKAFHSAPNAKHLSAEDGSAVLVVALMLSVLILIFGFVVRTGYSVARKHSFQAGLDAAALAGARSLCDGNPAAVARQVAVENGLPDSDDLTVQLGFYDELGIYPVFTQFSDFEPDPVPETPYVNEGVARISDGDYHYNNAVMVSVDTKTDDPTGGLGGGAVRTRDYAVAFLERYGMITGEDGFSVEPYAGQNPHFLNTVIHSNGNIQFNGTERFSGDCRVNATGAVDNCSIGCWAGAPEREVKPLDLVMEKLRAQAEAAGTLIDTSQWVADNIWHPTPFGHYMRPNSWSPYRIRLAERPHDGAVYFLTTPQTGSLSTIEVRPNESNVDAATGFTIATDASLLRFKLDSPLPTVLLGGEGEDTALFYAAQEILFDPSYGSNSRDFICKGVFFRCREFTFHGAKTDQIQKMRIVADAILLDGDSGFGPNPTPYATQTFEGLFGPPCPPHFVRLGSLAANE